MTIQFDKTSGPTLGAKPSIRSLHAPGAQRNYKTQCSAAYDPLESVVLDPLLPFGKFTQALLDGAALIINLALIALFVCATAAAVGAAIFFALFCKF